ncbi:MAG: cell wall-binding repeat-containing protein [Peptococcaceae bacterium]|nr:cell wall-binding repeat-containing protein [Peptococcaceae bacterium]
MRTAKKTSKLLILNIDFRITVTILCCIAVFMITFLSEALLAGSIIRYTEEDPIDMALQVCDTLWTSDSSAMILASSDEEDKADVLCAAPLSGQEKAPILLTDRDILDERVAKKITALKPKKIYLLGGISDTLSGQIRDLKLGTETKIYPVRGQDPEALSRAITRELKDIKGTFIINRDNMADGVSISAFAAANAYQILLADDQGCVPEDQIIWPTYLIGSEARIQDVKEAKRLFGRDRYETNRIIVTTLSHKFSHIWIASGEDSYLMNALLMSPAAAAKNAAIILSSPANNTTSASGDLKQLLESSQCYVMGDEKLISQDAVKTILTTIGQTWKAVGTWDELKDAVDSGKSVFLIQDISAEKGDELWIKRPITLDGQGHKLESRIWVISTGVIFKDLSIELKESSRDALLSNNAVVYSENNLHIESTVAIKGPAESSFHGLFVENTLSVGAKANLKVQAGKSTLFEGDGIKAGRLIIEDHAIVEGIGGDGDHYSGTGIMVYTLSLEGEPYIIGTGGQVRLTKDYNQYSPDPYEAMNERNYPHRVGNGIQCSDFRSDADATPTVVAQGGMLISDGFKPSPRAAGGCGFVITLSSSPKAQIAGSFTEDVAMKTKLNLYYNVPYNVSGYAVYNHGKEPLNLYTIELDMYVPPKERLVGAAYIY